MQCTRQNTLDATRKDRAGTTAADNPTDDHIVGMVVKARAAMGRYADGRPRIEEAVAAQARHVRRARV